MSVKKIDNICLVCRKRKYDFKTGILCSLDNKKHQKKTCEYFETDAFKVEEHEIKSNDQKFSKTVKIIFLSVILLFVVLYISIHFVKRFNNNKKHLADSLEIAELIENESIGRIRNKLSGKVTFNRDKQNSKIIGEPGLLSIIDYIINYKGVEGYIALKKQSKVKSGLIHLTFLAANSYSEYNTDIFVITTSRKKGKTVITDFYSYSKGEWQSKILENYLVIIPIFRNKEPVASPQEEIAMSINYLYSIEAYIEVIDFINQIPDKYQKYADIQELLLDASLKASIVNDSNYFSEQFNNVIRKNKSSRFETIWSYRNALYTKNRELFEKTTKQIKEITGEDIIYDVNRIMFEENFKSYIEIQKDFKNIIISNPDLFYTYYMYREFNVLHRKKNKVKQIDKYIFNKFNFQIDSTQILN